MVKKKVVSVQDDEILNKVLIREIGNEELEVCEVDNGREGLILIRDQIPVLVILDPLVQELDGFTVLQELKGAEDTKDIPVIVISILSGESDIKKFMDMGAEDYIVKSQHSTSEIVEKIRFHLSKNA